MPQTVKAQVVKAIMVKPGAGPRREVRASGPPTYRLVLVREDTGKIMHAWSAIPHDKVGPLLDVMQRYLPWLARAAAARDALDKLFKLFG